MREMIDKYLRLHHYDARTIVESSCHPPRHSDLLGVTPPMYFLRQVRLLLFIFNQSCCRTVVFLQ